MPDNCICLTPCSYSPSCWNVLFLVLHFTLRSNSLEVCKFESVSKGSGLFTMHACEISAMPPSCIRQHAKLTPNLKVIAAMFILFFHKTFVRYLRVHCPSSTHQIA